MSAAPTPAPTARTTRALSRANSRIAWEATAAQRAAEDAKDETKTVATLLEEMRTIANTRSEVLMNVTKELEQTGSQLDHLLRVALQMNPAKAEDVRLVLETARSIHVEQFGAASPYYTDKKRRVEGAPAAADADMAEK